MAGDGLGAEGSSPDESVLKELVGNGTDTRASEEEADRLIAKALQDQERAFMLLNGFGGEDVWRRDERADEEEGSSSGWEEDEGGSAGADGLPAAHSSEDDDEDDDEDDEGESDDDDEDDDEDEPGGVPGGAAGVDAGGGRGRRGDPPAEDDAELARRLQEQEDREHYQRLMELAGGGGIAEYDEEEDEEGYVTEDSVDPDNMTYEELQALGEAVGTVSRGVPRSVIDALPNVKYASRFADQPTAKEAAEGEEQCAVCRMEFEPGEDVRLLPCSHVYHPDCISQWLHINKVCPICSKEVTQAAGAEAPKAADVLGPRNK